MRLPVLRLARRSRAFTLIELITVVSIIAILAALLSPVVLQVMREAQKKPALTDAMAIVTAISAFQADYGRFPFDQPNYEDRASNARLMQALRGIDKEANPKEALFLNAKLASRAPNNTFRGGVDEETGAFWDPWGTPFNIRIDVDHDNEVDNPFSGDSPARLRFAAIVWSVGADHKQGARLKESDDVVSWK